MEVGTGFEPVYTDLQSVASPLGHPTSGADDGVRTRDPHLGKVMLYQLSHVRKCVKRTAKPYRSRLFVATLMADAGLRWCFPGAFPIASDHRKWKALSRNMGIMAVY